MKKVKGIPQPFGVSAMGNTVNFSIQVEGEKECSLLLYRKGKEIPEYQFDMPRREGVGEVRFLALEGLKPERYEYNFCIDGKICVDPYVKAVAGKERFGDEQDVQEHQVRGKIVVGQYDWEGDERLHLPWHEVVAYSLHVRGFTKHSSSKVAHKGTFLGVAEKIPYLKELGINQIQCMPVYEFLECKKGKLNYWGYGPAYYFAPKSSYAAGKDAVQELKDLVKSCHKEGIEVVLEMPFVPEISAHMVIECLRYYMLEYHIDGFVVNPYSVPWEQLMQDPFLKDIKLMRKDESFQVVMRRFLKGDENMVNEVIWALGRHSSVDGKCNFITGHTGFTLWDLVSYDCKHNEANGENNLDGPDYNYSWNCGAEGPSRKKSIVTLRKNQVKNAFSLLLSAQGTPCILAGDEFYNSQGGNNNVYCQDNETGWVNWGRLKNDPGLFEYVKGLIAFRKAHPCLHRTEELKGSDRTGCGIPDVSYHGENAWQVKAEVSSRQLGVLYAGVEKEEPFCFVAYNMHWLPHSYALPSPGKGRKWVPAVSTDSIFTSEEAPLEDQKRVLLGERSILFLTAQPQEQDSQKDQKIEEKKEERER